MDSNSPSRRRASSHSNLLHLTHTSSNRDGSDLAAGDECSRLRDRWASSTFYELAVGARVRGMSDGQKRNQTRPVEDNVLADAAMRTYAPAGASHLTETTLPALLSLARAPMPAAKCRTPAPAYLGCSMCAHAQRDTTFIHAGVIEFSQTVRQSTRLLKNSACSRDVYWHSMHSRRLRIRSGAIAEHVDVMPRLRPGLWLFCR